LVATVSVFPHLVAADILTTQRCMLSLVEAPQQYFAGFLTYASSVSLGKSGPLAKEARVCTSFLRVFVANARLPAGLPVSPTYHQHEEN
jgi:hypothetical protein